MTDNKKYPWEKYPEIWPTEASFMSYIRGGIRRGLWNRYPVKLEYIKNNRERIPNPNPRGRVKEVWGGTCYITGKKYPIAELEVDHKKGHLSLKSSDDLKTFIEGILYLDETDLAFISKEAHKIKSYADRMGISFDEAEIEKKYVIPFGSLSAKKQKLKLLELGIEPAGTGAKRRNQYRNFIKNNEV